MCLPASIACVTRSARICVVAASKNTVSFGFFSAAVEVGGRAGDAVLLAQRRDLLGIAADQDRVGHHAVAVRQRHAALIADGQDRAHEVLVEPHASGDAVHDDAEIARRHVSSHASVRHPGSRKAAIRDRVNTSCAAISRPVFTGSRLSLRSAGITIQPGFGDRWIPENQVRSLIPSRVSRVAFCRFTASGGCVLRPDRATCRTVSKA